MAWTTPADWAVQEKVTAAKFNQQIRDNLRALRPGYGTVFPTNPAPSDGDEFVLVDSITAPTFAWHFRYNAGATSALKWEYIGGTPLIGFGTANSTANTTYSTGGQAIVTLPAATSWDLLIRYNGVGDPAHVGGGAIGILSISIAGVTAVDADGALGASSSPVRELLKTGIAGAQTVGTAWRSTSQGTSAYLGASSIAITPRRGI